MRSLLLRVTVDDVELPGALSANIDSNNHFASDRFRVQFAASLVPQEALHIAGARMEIFIGLNGTWLSCIVGVVDAVNFDPTSGVVDVEGRDLSAQLIETQTDETFANQTSSEVAVLFGVRHGLLVAAEPTTTPIGRYYQSEHDRVTLSQFSKAMTEWDLLAYLATREGFDLFMEGPLLRFGRPLTEGAILIAPENCLSCQLNHCVGLSRPMRAVVKSWNSKSGEAVTGQASSVGLGPIWERRITRPNLTAADAQTQAERVIGDLKRHEWSANITMPGDLSLTARSVVALANTSSAWDRVYSVSQLSRRIDVRRGFTQHFSLQGIS